MKCSKRYKIEKKVKEHHRKLKKEAKKKGGKKRSHKDPGIPRDLPFRDKIVEEALAAKAQAEEERRLERERKFAEKKRLAAESKKSSLENLMKDAESRSRTFENKAEENKEEFGRKIQERTSSAFYSDLKRVIEKSDVILQVIDARDPIGTRCTDIEQRILKAGKRLVLVMNKIDLVPREIVEQWLKVLQSQFPAVAFKASTQNQRSNLVSSLNIQFSSLLHGFLFVVSEAWWSFPCSY